MCHVSCVMCHVSHVTCHMSPVTCHKSPVACHMSEKNFFFHFFILKKIYICPSEQIGQSGGSSRWRVCYQWGLPYLVLTLTWKIFNNQFVTLRHPETFSENLKMYCKIVSYSNVSDFMCIYCPHCGARGRGFFRGANSFGYISRQWMTSLDLCLPPGQGSQLRRRQPALAGLASPRHHRREAGGH